MLIQFSVENFKSFKEKALLSLQPSSDDSHPDNLSSLDPGCRVLNSLAIYGANAAGKTNLFKAMTMAILMVRNSSRLQVNDRLEGMVPFLFDPETAARPASFEFVCAVGGIKYIYGFSASTERIESEYLYAYYSYKPTTIFERDGEAYTFVKDRRKLDQIAEMNTPNKLFLSTATAWNYDRTEPVFKWFAQGINTYPAYEELVQLAFDQIDREDRTEVHQFAINLLREADINIDDFAVETEPMSDQEMKLAFGPFYQALKDQSGFSGSRRKVMMDHLVVREDGRQDRYRLNISDESKGTESLFMLAPILLHALKTGETVIIDEIERSLHPLLVKHVIGYFHDPVRNPNHAQLVFNTHNLELMSLEIFRRDQIYFVDKSTKTGASELYSLDDFSVRSEENIRKGYLLGRFGAIPSILEGEAQ